MKKCKNNNRGFTLIELIIATAVLSIIMAPLMRAFVIAANTSRLTNIYGETSTAIKNVVELITGTDISGIDDESVDEIEQVLKNLPAYDDGSATPEIAITSIGATDSNGDSLHATSKGFTLTNVNMGNDMGEAGKIDVIITPIDPNETDKTELSFNDWYGAVNSTDFSSYTAMDMTLIQPGVIADTSVTPALKTLDSANHVDFRAVAKMTGGTNSGLTNVNRTIGITLVPVEIKNPDYDEFNPTLHPEYINDPDKINYTVRYEYTSQFGGSPASAGYTEFTGDAAYGSDGVCSIQLAYYPMYANDETILISNREKLPVNVFLMKQDMSGLSYSIDQSPSANIVERYETSYSCDVELYEYEAGDTAANSNHSTYIFSNMDTNLMGTGAMTGSFVFTYKGSDYISDVTGTLKDKLVADSSGGRGFNVLVKAYQKNAAGNWYLADQVQTVKLI